MLSNPRIPTAVKLNSLALSIALALTSTAVSAEKVAQEKNTDVAKEDIEVIQIHGKKTDADAIITQDALEKLSANSLADIFRNQAEISTGGSFGVAQKVYIRGIEDTMINVTIDGALQSGYLFHHQGRLSLEPELLKRVDVIAGAGDATSGSGALGGALRFETKVPEDLLQTNDDFGGIIKLGYYSNNSGLKTSGTLFGNITESVSGMITVAKTTGDNIVDGNGNDAPYTETDQDIGFAKIVAELTDEQKLSFSYESRADDETRLLRTHWHPSRKNPAIPQESHRETYTLNYDFNPQGNALIDLNVNVYNTDNSIEHLHFDEESNTSNIYYAVFESTGIALRNTSLLAQHKIVSGFDYRQDDAKLEDLGTNYLLEGKEEGTVYGLYAQDYFTLNEHLMLSYGVRYDDYELLDDRQVKYDSNGFSPNVNATYAFNDHFSIYTGYAQAIRGQKVKELFVLGYYSNEEGLSEETAKNYEIGFNYMANGLTISGDIYRSDILDVVSTAKNLEGTSSSELKNVGDIKNVGFNINARYSWSDFSLGLGYSNSNPEWQEHINPILVGQSLSDQDFSVGTSVGNTWVIDLNYAVHADVELSWVANISKRLTDAGVNVWTGDQLPEKSGYAVHDIMAKWYVMGSEALSLNVAVKNIFDKFYYDHATYGTYGPIDTGVAEAGRDFRLTLAWQF
ncbi:MAG: TonB-dependent receptor [Colwellia sp.]|nr:TonB-dependent receptor [Colwellia sp.]